MKSHQPPPLPSKLVPRPNMTAPKPINTVKCQMERIQEQLRRRPAKKDPAAYRPDVLEG